MNYVVASNQDEGKTAVSIPPPSPAQADCKTAPSIGSMGNIAIFVKYRIHHQVFDTVFFCSRMLTAVQSAFSALGSLAQPHSGHNLRLIDPLLVLDYFDSSFYQHM